MTRLAHIPANLIAGPLGAGKTTAILHLLARRGNGRWAVLVNDFGAVGVDGAMLDAAAGGITVRQVAGGCMCCARGVETRVALTRLLREARPERLLIEPSGLGHPAGILDLLTGPEFAGVLQPRAVVCLLDPRTLAAPSPARVEMARIADVLVASQCDRATPADLARFDAFAAALYPPKTRLARIAHGQLELEWLDLEPSPRPAFLSVHPDAPPSTWTSTVIERGIERMCRAGPDGSACGWVFPPALGFRGERLADTLGGLLAQGGVVRAKGILRTGREWLLLNWAGGPVQLEPAAWRRDSRMEILAGAGTILPWADWEHALLGLLRPD